MERQRQLDASTLRLKPPSKLGEWIRGLNEKAVAWLERPVMEEVIRLSEKYGVSRSEVLSLDGPRFWYKWCLRAVAVPSDIILAILNRDSTRIEQLLEKGVDPLAWRLREASSPLEFAARYGDANCMHALVKSIRPSEISEIVVAYAIYNPDDGPLGVLKEFGVSQASISKIAPGDLSKYRHRDF